MSQKVCGGYISVMPYAVFLKRPKIEQFQFFPFFCSKSDHVLFSGSIFYVRFFEIPHFRTNIGSNDANDSKMGHLKKRA